VIDNDYKKFVGSGRRLAPYGSTKPKRGSERIKYKVGCIIVTSMYRGKKNRLSSPYFMWTQLHLRGEGGRRYRRKGEGNGERI